MKNQHDVSFYMFVLRKHLTSRRDDRPGISKPRQEHIHVLLLIITWLFSWESNNVQIFRACRSMIDPSCIDVHSISNSCADPENFAGGDATFKLTYFCFFSW